MTASELIDRIREAGGKLRVRDGQLYSKQIPEALVSELSRLKPEVIGLLLDENFCRLVERFKLKEVRPARFREIEAGGRWRILSTQPQPWWRGSRYRWQQVCHMGASDSSVMSPMGRLCSQCYPFPNGSRPGRLLHVDGECTATRHAAEHMLWAPEPEEVK